MMWEVCSKKLSAELIAKKTAVHLGCSGGRAQPNKAANQRNKTRFHGCCAIKQRKIPVERCHIVAFWIHLDEELNACVVNQPSMFKHTANNLQLTKMTTTTASWWNTSAQTACMSVWRDRIYVVPDRPLGHMVRRQSAEAQYQPKSKSLRKHGRCCKEALKTPTWLLHTRSTNLCNKSQSSWPLTSDHQAQISAVDQYLNFCSRKDKNDFVKI